MNKMFLTVALLLILNQSINANVVCPNTEVLTVGCAKVPGELCGVVAVCRSDLVCTDHTCRYREGFNATAGIDIRYLETPGFTSSYENNRDYYWSISAPYGRE
uniref:uncharacterized protein LOC108950181 n=1 Tax=Ciona intestinalis TaxID=7719 RepID=UPI000180AF85